MNLRRRLDIQVFLYNNPIPLKPIPTIVIVSHAVRPYRHKNKMCETCPHRLTATNCLPAVYREMRALIDSMKYNHGCHEEPLAFCRGHALELVKE
jgi:hypothetical protein